MKTLIINSMHGFTRPVKTNTAKKYRVEYGAPDFSVYLGKYADSAIMRLHYEGYTVLVYSASGKNYVLAKNFMLVSLDGREIAFLRSYDYDEVIIDMVTKTARIWVEM